ncbi:KIF15, partial [Symbiodinium sp. KB8]
MSASDGGGAETIQVVCRLRPLSKREAGSASVLEVQDDARTVALKGASVKDFTYDRVFGPDTAQSELFEAVGRPLTEACAAGFHGTVFAYGQTGSGKTHTILGEGNGDEARLLPRVLRHLFATTAQRTGQVRKMKLVTAEKGSKVSYTTKCSFLEIYNERIIDLLDAASTNLALREDSDKGVYVDGLTEEEVACPEDALALMKRGARNRHIGATAMNRHSSRSHSVFTLRIECRETEASGLTKTRHARFNLIDLAGSERQKGTGAEGARLREASNINKSLSELGNVIQALAAVSSGRSVAHVPYRNSKLTFLLRDSLGGNSKTFLVATVSPAEEAFGETLSTLKFASRAKLVKNQAVVNEDTAGSFALLQAEVRRLQAALAEARTAITSGGAAADGTAHAQGACTPAALAVAAVAPSLAKMEALFQALAASHRATSRAGAGDAGASPDHTSLPAGLALELLAKAHADATDTGLPPLGSLSAAA